MSSPVIRFVDRVGNTLFAYDPLTINSTHVLRELAWAYPAHQKICPAKHCPADQQGYCLECHSVAATARSIVIKRDEAAAA